LAEIKNSGKFNVRIKPKLDREIALRAAQEHRSLNDWVVDAL
jgi:predicted HicB family RNase H-like nuclease